MRATVVCDASFYRCDKTRVTCAGWAAWVKCDSGVLIKGYGSIKAYVPDNTVAEVYAALNGIWLATQKGATHILIRSDCLAVVGLANGTHKNTRLLGIWADGIQNHDMSGVITIGRHVKGHGVIKDSASWVNNWADVNSRKAQRDARKGKHDVVIWG